MSRNSKNARLHREAKQLKHAEFKGGEHVSTGRKGPSSTTPKHGKKNAWFQHFDSYSDFVKAQGKISKKTEE